VLYIATVHYGSPRWIEIQARHLRQHISIPYRTWGSLELIDQSYAVHFDRVLDQAGRHSDKLNHLALEISHEASDDDMLMFLDGDAFPIADPMPLITQGLAIAPLIAVRRAENANDQQPHPCFCVTTVGAWRSLPGDWSAGYTWLDEKGRRVSDVGANLLRQLELTRTPWVQVLRSNQSDLDPIFFGVYGDVIYHHGAGFRTSEFSRAHHTRGPRMLPVPSAPILNALVRRINALRQRIWVRSTRTQHATQSQRIVEEIERGGSDWLTHLM
jgi:hypothetical protein